MPRTKVAYANKRKLVRDKAVVSRSNENCIWSNIEQITNRLA